MLLLTRGGRNPERGAESTEAKKSPVLILLRTPEWQGKDSSAGTECFIWGLS